MAGDLTTIVTELLDNSDVLRKMKSEEAALAKVDAKAKALGVTRGQLLKAMKAEDAERDRAIKDQLRQAAVEEKYLAEVKQRSFAMERAAEKSERYYSTQNALIGSTGQLSQGMGSLSQQLADVAVGLQGGQKPMTILVQQGPQIADIFRNNAALAAKFSGALGVLGASAAGAVALGTPLIAWSKALDEQNEKTRATTAALSAAIDQMGEGASAIGGLQKELERSALRLSGQEGIVEGMEAGEKAGGAYADMLQGLNRQLAIHQKMLADVEDGSEGFLEAAFGPSGVERVQQADRLKATIADLTAEIKAMEKEQAIAADTAELVALGERALADETKGGKKARKEKTEDLKEQVVTLEEIIAQDERMAAQERELAEQAKRLHDQQIDDWVDGVMKRRAAEVKAAEESAAAWAGFARGTQTMIGNLADFAGTMADKMADENEQASLKSFRIQQAAEVVEATIAAVRIGQEFAKFAAKINPVLAFPAGAAAFAAAEAAYVAPIANQKPPTFDDTPGVQRMSGSRNVVSLAGDDYFAAAKDPADLARQVKPFAPAERGGSMPTISTKLIVSGRTAQKIEQAARTTKRGYTIGQPVAGHRRTRY